MTARLSASPRPLAHPTAPPLAFDFAFDFDRAMAACPQAAAASHLTIGVSGGGDSMALCLLVAGWARARGVDVTALTVDHGLRPESGDEARQVGAWLRARQINHSVLPVRRGIPKTGKQQAARTWRFEALDAWQRDHAASRGAGRGGSRVLLAHTAEDQEETVILRTLSDSGPDGLAGMAREVMVGGLAISRPLLGVSRESLRNVCRSFKQPWIDDPCNLDPDYTRARVRLGRGRLDGLGLTGARLGRVAGAMAGVRGAVDRHCAAFMKAHGFVSAFGIAGFERRALTTLPVRFGDLLLSRLLRAIGGGAWPPRNASVTRLRHALTEGAQFSGVTLGGCMVTVQAGRVLIYREPGAVAGECLVSRGRPTRWDNRFEVLLYGGNAAKIGPLGEEGWRILKQCHPEFLQASGLARLPHCARLSIPVLRHLDGRLSLPQFVGVGPLICESADHRYGEQGTREQGAGEYRSEMSFRPDQDWIAELVENRSTACLELRGPGADDKVTAS